MTLAATDHNLIALSFTEQLDELGLTLEEARNILDNALIDYEGVLENRAEAQHIALHANGPASDAGYRASMIAAGRGHLLGGR